MTKDDFLKLNKLIGQLPPDNCIRKEYIEKKFSEYGLSIESGYKSVQYFYNELCKARDNETSIFKGEVITDENTFGIVDRYTCYLKMSHDSLLKRKEIFFPTKVDKPQLEKQETELPETLEQLFEYQNFLIPKVSIKEVYEHFKILTEKTNKFNEFYLTNEQLSKFIKSTFIDKKPIKQKLNCKTFIKKDIRKVFHEFYLSNKNHEPNLSQVKQKYFDILNNAFDGFNKNDYTDFHKT